MRYLFFTIFILSMAASNVVQGQDDKFNATTFNFTYALQSPGGDLATDFNWNFNVGTGIQYFTENKWILGAEANFIFGGEPKMDMLANFRTADGEILTEDRSYAVIFQEERGFYAGLLAGKLIPLSKLYPKSGLRLTVSGGIFQHQIRLEDRTGTVPQLAGDYKKGYDRLTNGFALTEFIGYQHFGNNGLINFYIGMELTQGFTKNRRSWDYLAQQRLDQPRLDLINGIRIGWVLALISESYDGGEVFF